MLEVLLQGLPARTSPDGGDLKSQPGGAQFSRHMEQAVEAQPDLPLTALLAEAVAQPQTAKSAELTSSIQSSPQAPASDRLAPEGINAPDLDLSGQAQDVPPARAVQAMPARQTTLQVSEQAVPVQARADSTADRPSLASVAERLPVHDRAPIEPQAEPSVDSPQAQLAEQSLVAAPLIAPSGATQPAPAATAPLRRSTALPSAQQPHTLDGTSTLSAGNGSANQMPEAEHAPPAIDLALESPTQTTQRAELAILPGRTEGMVPSVLNPGMDLAPAPVVSMPTAIQDSLAGPRPMQAEGAITPQQLPAIAMASIRQHGLDQAEARLSLHPAELGQLDMKIEQDGQRLEMSITVDNEQARRAVQDQLAQLRERLAQAGMELASLDISLRDQDERQNHDEAPLGENHASEEPANIPSSRPVVMGENALDLYA